jgi:hypothetical protein
MLERWKSFSMLLSDLSPWAEIRPTTSHVPPLGETGGTAIQPVVVVVATSTTTSTPAAYIPIVEQRQETPVIALLVAGSVVGGVLFLTLPFIVMPFISGQTLPYMATPIKKLQDAFRFIQLRRRQQHNYYHHTGNTHNVVPLHRQRQRHFLDLGSGDGETIYQALRLLNTQNASEKHEENLACYYYYSCCTGVELNTTLYLWSWWRRTLFWTKQERSRATFLCRDMFQPSSLLLHNCNNTNANLIHHAHTIFIFGIPALMSSISHLLVRHQCQPGTYIICYRFPLPIDDNLLTVPLKRNCRADNLNQHCLPLLPATLIYEKDEMRIYECRTSDISNNKDTTDPAIYRS